MGPDMEGLAVVSHTPRDLLQNAAVFKTEKAVVWEYVSNGLEYVDVGISPVVDVKVQSKLKKIVVSDNGRGMDKQGLQNFFIMHGENIDRLEGKPGRGMFGTGKSAAFGIANVLRISTVRNGKRSTVELSRKDIENTSNKDRVPVKTIEMEVPTEEANGTTVEIKDIQLRHLDVDGIIKYMERNLHRWPKDVSVIVNSRECEVSEPPIDSVHRFKPVGEDKEILGDVELIVNVSKVVLDEDQQGISVFCNGVWHETTLAGEENRSMSNYIFGEFDIPKLDEDTSPIKPFDLTRSQQLNTANPLVNAIHAFIGKHVKEIRKTLVEKDREREASEEAKRLDEEAQKISQMINEDFTAFKSRIAKVKAKVPGSADMSKSEPAGDEEEDFIYGSSIPAVIIADNGSPGSSGGSGGEGTDLPDAMPLVQPKEGEEKRAKAVGGKGKTEGKPTGGFNVKFEHHGEDEKRAKYISKERTIYVNLDFPQLVAAREKSSTEDPLFKRLAYEIAFSEYAIALAYELDEREEFTDTSDPIYEIRETLNRMGRRAASLYQ